MPVWLENLAVKGMTHSDHLNWLEVLLKAIRIDTRTSPNEEKVYPLSGLVVCGDCGAMMIKRDVPAGGKCWTRKGIWKNWKKRLPVF